MYALYFSLLGLNSIAHFMYIFQLAFYYLEDCLSEGRKEMKETRQSSIEFDSLALNEFASVGPYLSCGYKYITILDSVDSICSQCTRSNFCLG